MVVYEIYSRNKKGERELIGVLSERRVNMERVTSDSLNEWLKAVFSANFDANDILIVQKTV